VTLLQEGGLTATQYAVIYRQLYVKGKLDLEWTGPSAEYDIGLLNKIPIQRRRLAELELLQLHHTNRRELERERLHRLSITHALNGDMELAVIPAGPLSMPASKPNGLVAGKCKQRVIVHFRDGAGDNHLWSAFPLTIQLAESVADADVDAPTIVPATVTLDSGKAEFDLVLDTDAGATKTYAAADSVSVTVKVASDDKILGWTVTAAVLTINIT
jgi:hypothetical protein